MTGQEIIVTSLVITTTGFFMDVWSERLNDLFVRRVSIAIWFVIGVTVTAVCQLIYQKTGDVAAVTVAASVLTIIGEVVGIKITNHLKEGRIRRVQERAKRAATWENL